VPFDGLQENCPWTSSPRRAAPPSTCSIRRTVRPGAPNLGPPGAVLHRSPPATVALYDEGCELVDAQVRAAFWDKTPDWIGTDPPDLERPHVEVCVPDSDAMQVYLTPGQARAFAAAVVRAADAADTEAFYRTPVPSGVSSVAASASAPPQQA